MKLLVVDDEINTRKGIIGRLPLRDMGIVEVQEADDGIHGLNTASTFAPDIILTDVKMPRMNGVEMMYKIRELKITCPVIFMSGYSDKEYLKSAIELNALNYIEKPINMNELMSALQKSILLCNSEKHKKAILNTSISLICHELALKLVSAKPDWSTINSYIKKADLNISEDSFFVNILIRISTSNANDHIHSSEQLFDNIIKHIQDTTKFSGFWAVKNEEYVIFHIYTNKVNRHSFSKDKLIKICYDIMELLSSSFSVSISLGEIVTGFKSIYSSYKTAVLGMQRAFYHNANCLLTIYDSLSISYIFSDQMLKDLSEAMKQEDQSKCRFIVKSLTSELRRYDTTLVSECKDFYYKILFVIVNTSISYGFKLQEVPDNDSDTWEMFLHFKTLTEVESFVLRQIDEHYQFIQKILVKDTVVIQAIQYIHNHYHDENLSINQISNYTHLNSTYLSFVFKKNTNKPLVKYINDYRMEKSKELLLNYKLKINDIAILVGYSDGNYFTKIFRKTYGLTPSEYRERRH